MISLATVLFATCSVAAIFLFTVRRVRSQGIELVTAFLGFHLILITLPFLSFAWAGATSGSLQPLVRRNIDNWFVIPTLINGRAVVVTIMFDLLLIGALILVSKRPTRSRSSLTRPDQLQQLDTDRYRQLAFAIGGASIAYMLLRMVIVGDFPLWSLLNGQGVSLRDRSFAFATNLDVPYVFRASITRLVLRYAMPLSWLMLLSYRRFTKRNDALTFEYVLALSTLVLALGSVKRSNLVLLTAWLVFLTMSYGKFVLRRVLAGAAFAFSVVITFTVVYAQSGNGGTVEAIRRGYQRVSFDEAIFEWVALENFGSGLDHLGAQPIIWQIEKALGGTGQTFGGYWKETSLGPDSRGWSSIGVVGELWAIGGWVSLIIGGSLFAFMLAWLSERFKVFWAQPLLRPAMSGFMVSMSAVSVKGLMTQSLGGGLIALTGALCVTLWLTFPRDEASMPDAESGPEDPATTSEGHRDADHAR